MGWCETIMKKFVWFRQKSWQNLSVLGALKNRKIFVNHEVSITWMHKLHLRSTWTWKFSLKAKLGTMIVVLLVSWVLIIIHAALGVRIFCRHHSITVLKANFSFAAFLLNESNLGREIKFSWLTFPWNHNLKNQSDFTCDTNLSCSKLKWWHLWILVRLPKIW